jgi:tetratricopeptide (TPR) repeat protein
MILGQIGHYHGQYVEEERFSQESIATLEKIGDRRFTAYAISNLGRVALALGKYEQAETYHQDCLQRRTELGDQGGLAFTLKDLGNLSLAQRQLDRAKDFYQQSLAIAEKIDSTYSKIQALWGMGKSAHALGNYAEAKAFFQESLILNSKSVVPELIPLYRADLGWTTLALAEYQETEQYFTRTMRAAVDNQAFPVILDALAGLAVLLTVREPAKKETVIELLTLVLHHPACHQETKDRIANRYAALVAELPPEAVAAAQARGQALDLLAVATEWLDTPSPDHQ